jgi:dihydrofolate reductase
MMKMGIVTTGFSMSLDGYVAAPEDDVGRLFQWYSSGASDEVPMGEGTMKVSAEGAKEIQDASKAAGALVAGRRLFELTHGWGGRHPLDVPVVVVTHRDRPEWVTDDSIFTFVTDGVESAIAQAKIIAGEKNVAVASPSIAQQCITAGLLDEVHIDLISVLLGDGIRLFEHLGVGPVELESTRASLSPGVMHLTFRIVK